MPQPTHICNEAPIVRIAESIAKCYRCGWLIDFTTDETIAATREELFSVVIGLGSLPSSVKSGYRLDLIDRVLPAADREESLRT